MDFRSPYLSTIPRRKDALPFQEIGIRLMMTIAFFMVLFALGSVIVSGLLPGSGLGLYWLHDHVFLPVKGVSFTQFYPWSLLWWGIPALALIWRVLVWVTGAAVTDRITRELASHAVMNPSIHRQLLGFERRFRKGKPSRQLLIAAQYHYELTMDEMVRSPQPEIADIAARQCAFLLEILTLPGWSEDERIKGLTAGLHTLVALNRANSASDNLLDSMTRVIEVSRPISMERLHGAGFAGWRKTELIADLLWTLAFFHEPARITLVDGAFSDENEVRGQLLRRAHIRVQSLWAAARFVEYAGEDAFVTESDHPALQPFSVLAQEDAGIYGRLGLELCLVAAEVGSESGLAMSALDAVDSLHLAFDLALAQRPPRRRGTSLVARDLHQLILGLPIYRHHILAAQAGQMVSLAAQRSWRRTPLSGMEAVSAEVVFAPTGIELEQAFLAGGLQDGDVKAGS